MIELPQWTNGVVQYPGSAAVLAGVDASVVTHGHDARILRADPDGVIVGMRTLQRLPGLAAVERDLGALAADDDLVGVGGIDHDAAEVQRPLVLIALELPGCAAVIGAKHAARGGVLRRARSARGLGPARH